MKHLFTLLLLANTAIAFAQEDTVQAQEIKVEEVKMKSGDVQLQPTTGVAIATHGLPGEGQLPGVVCRFPSSAGEQKPLYVIDGVPSSLEGLNALNPNDIVSIEILKDATSINLCNRSNNGVIIIKTKNGLTKRELRKQKRLERRTAKKLVKE